ncbi:MAG TPA: hypothetical protein VIK74_11780 [Parasegetibacter sp.]|jgi:hypothetical protein
MKKLRSIVSIAAFSVVIVACSSTRVTSSWKSPDAPASNLSYNRVMVVALLAEKDRSLQQKMETALVDQLVSKGVAATSAYQEFGPGFSNRNERQVMRQLKATGADAVMTIVLLDKTKEEQYVPGNAQFAPVGFYYNRFWGYYSYMYDRIYSPGYYTTTTGYFWESNLYDLKADKIVYSVQTESFDPPSAENLAREYASKITENMMREGVLIK